MLSRTRSAVRILAASVLAVASMTLLPAPAWAAGLTGTLSPTAVTAGATNTFHVALSSSDGALIGSFTVAVPREFTINSASNPQGGVLPTATVNKADNTVTVTGLANSNVSVDINAVNPTEVGVYTWSASARDPVLGELGSTSLPAVTVSPAAAAALAFVQGPSTVAVNTAMTPAVKVKAVDAFGNTVTGYGSPVTLAYVSNPTGAAQPSGRTATPSSGIATFAALTFPTVGQGYTIRATSDGLTSPESGPFSVGQSVVACIPDSKTPCDSGEITRSDPDAGVTTKARVVSDPAGTADVLVSYLDGEARPCGTSSVGATLTYDVTNRPSTITYTLAAMGPASNNTVPPLTRGVCFESTMPFAGSQPDPARPGFYYGNLSSCGKPAIRPCQSGTKTQSNPRHSVTITVLAPGGDPKIGP